MEPTTLVLVLVALLLWRQVLAVCSFAFSIVATTVAFVVLVVLAIVVFAINVIEHAASALMGKASRKNLRLRRRRVGAVARER